MFQIYCKTELFLILNKEPLTVFRSVLFMSGDASGKNYTL